MNKDPKTGRFVQGNSGGGRPKGSRNKFGNAFFDALYKDFKEHGENAIVAAREKDPPGYLRVIASLMPKEAEMTIRRGSADELSDDELATIIRDGSGDGADTQAVDPAKLN